MKPETIRISLTIPASLHNKLQEAAARRGCSTRHLIINCLEYLAAKDKEEFPRNSRHQVQLPLVPPAGRGVLTDVTSDQALFG